MGGVGAAAVTLTYGGAMPRTLLVTNDFPPRPGGIQSYLHSFASRFPEDELVVYAPRWRGDSHVKFDARQPLRRAGADTVVASTHGHEVGWSMIPGARSTLRTIGNSVDTVTYVSKYTRSRFASAFGPEAALEHVPPGVDTERFKPDAGARAELRARYGLGDRPTVLCLSRLVPRKGQDVLIRSLTGIRKRIDGAVLVIVGGGPYEKTLRELARRSGVEEHVVFTGTVPSAELAAHHTIADVFAMPSRTRGAGLDVEGLGIVYLEASACGVPVIAGMSGGAPETVLQNKTGLVVDGRSVEQITEAVANILGDRALAASMGMAGRRWVQSSWRWDVLAEKLRRLL